MILSIIVAYAKDENGARVIGKNNEMPWHFPHDLERFKEHTTGCPVIMGRKTHESIGRVLPGRENIILTQDRTYHVPGVIIFHDLDQAIQYTSIRYSEAFVIGGQQLYEQTIDRADRLYLTSFKIPNVEGDTFFPEFASGEFKVIHIERAGISGDCFRILERKQIVPQETPTPTETPPITGTSEVLIASEEDMTYDYPEYIV